MGQYLTQGSKIAVSHDVFLDRLKSKQLLFTNGLNNRIGILADNNVCTKCLRPEISEWSAFKEKFFLSNSYLNPSFQDQNKIIGGFSLLVNLSYLTVFVFIFQLNVMHNVLMEKTLQNSFRDVIRFESING